ncbi:MAG: TolC family protein [Vicingaceae bacterium]
MLKKRKSNIALLAILCLLGGLGKTNAQESLTLEQAITMGLENNYDIRLSRKAVDIAETENFIGNAGFLPEVTADGTYTESNQNTDLTFADGSGINRENAKTTTLNAGVGANWYIFDGTTMFVSKNQLEAVEKKSKYQLEAEINNSVAEITNTYHQLVAEEKTLLIYQEQKELSEAKFQLSKDRLSAGAGSELEQSQSEVELNADRAAVIEQEIIITQLKSKLNRLMGREVETNFEAADSIRIVSDLTLEELKQKVEENPNLKSYQQDLSIAVLNKKQTLADRLPSLALNGRYSYNESESEAGFVQNNQTDGLTYGATVSIPIFNGMQRSRKSQVNKIQIEQSKLTYENEVAKVKEQLQVQFQSYSRYQELLKMEQRNAAVADDNLKFAMESYKIGGISALDLREIQLSTLQAKERLVAIKYTIKMAETELLRLTNQLIEGK